MKTEEKKEQKPYDIELAHEEAKRYFGLTESLKKGHQLTIDEVGFIEKYERKMEILYGITTPDGIPLSQFKHE